jgi:hypothetical protein
MDNVQIVAYNENLFNISSDAKEEALKDKQVGVGINPMLRYKDGTNAVGCQLRVVYTLEGRFVMEYAAVITVLIEGWNEFLKKDPDDTEKIKASKAAWREALSFARGAISVNAIHQGNKIIAGLMLPNVDIDKFMLNVAIEKVV